MINDRSLVITGLDIGSSKTAAVCARIDSNCAIEILAQASAASKGISRGAFVDLAGAVDSVSRVLAKLSDKVSKKMGDIYVNITGETVRGSKSTGMVPLSLRGREVTRLDIERCVNAASTIRVPFDREIVHKIVHNFSIDDQPWIKNPLGLYASRLACEVCIVTASVSHIQNIYKCVNSAGYDVKEAVFTPLADAAGLLGLEEKEAGVLLIDTGTDLTEVSIFSGGALRVLDIIPFGARDIKGNFRDNADLNSAMSRIASRLGDFSQSGSRINSAVITGGITFLDGIAEFLEEKLSCRIRAGVIRGIRGDISGPDSIRLGTAMGLCKYAYEVESKRRWERNIAKRLSTKVIELFNSYF